MVQALKENGAISFVDLSEAMIGAKSKSSDPIWLKLDTHYNGIGAYYAYRAIADALGTHLGPRPILEQNELQRIDALPHELWHDPGNLARFMSAGDLLHEPWIGYAPIEPCAHPADVREPSWQLGPAWVPYASECPDQVGNAMVIGGSFRWGLVPYLSEHFGRVVYADFRHCFFDEAFVESEAPDVILFVLAERQFTWEPTPPTNNVW
jgi:hypothetical protein